MKDAPAACGGFLEHIIETSSATRRLAPYAMPSATRTGVACADAQLRQAASPLLSRAVTGDASIRAHGDEKTTHPNMIAGGFTGLPMAANRLYLACSIHLSRPKGRLHELKRVSTYPLPKCENYIEHIVVVCPITSIAYSLRRSRMPGPLIANHRDIPASLEQHAALGMPCISRGSCRARC